MYAGGYTGKVLRVNLTDKTFKEEPLAVDVAQAAYGNCDVGRGGGARVLRRLYEGHRDRLQPSCCGPGDGPGDDRYRIGNGKRIEQRRQCRGPESGGAGQGPDHYDGRARHDRIAGDLCAGYRAGRALCQSTAQVYWPFVERYHNHQGGKAPTDFLSLFLFHTR